MSRWLRDAAQLELDRIGVHCRVHSVDGHLSIAGAVDDEQASTDLASG